jgi:uncharacterized membrane protein
LSPGAALVFLLASPATNFGSLLAVRQLLGGRGLTLHLAGLAAVTLVCGLVLDLLVGAFGLRVLAQVGEHRHGAAGPLQIAAAALLALLLAGALWRALAGRSAAHPLEAEPTPS